MTDTETRSKRKLIPRRSTTVIALLLVGAAAGCVYFYGAWRHAVAANPNSQQKSTISKVNELAVTPNEQPQLATVKDAAKLANSALAKKTKNGDVLLVYGTAKRIIIYRPSINKIVDILTVQAPTTTSGATTKTTK